MKGFKLAGANGVQGSTDVQTFEVISSHPIQKPDIVTVSFSEIKQPEVIKPTFIHENIWEVEQQPIYDHKGNKINSYKALTRSDNGQILSVVSRTYQPFENRKFYDVCNTISNDKQLVSINEYADGSRLVAKFKSEPFEVRGHTFTSYMMFTNSHDYSTPLSMGEYNSMMRCNNQFSKVQGFSFRHTSQIQDFNFAQFYAQYEILKQMLVQTFEQLASINVSAKDTKNFLNSLFKVSATAAVSSRKSNILDVVNDCIAIETGDLGHNAFALFNAVTRYTTHHARTQDRNNSLMFGHINALNQKALNYFL